MRSPKPTLALCAVPAPEAPELGGDDRGRIDRADLEHPAAFPLADDCEARQADVRCNPARLAEGLVNERLVDLLADDGRRGSNSGRRHKRCGRAEHRDTPISGHAREPRAEVRACQPHTQRPIR
jgi:hypothetical protein